MAQFPTERERTIRSRLLHEGNTRQCTKTLDFLHGMASTTMPIALTHGEGRAYFTGVLDESVAAEALLTCPNPRIHRCLAGIDGLRLACSGYDAIAGALWGLGSRGWMNGLTMARGLACFRMQGGGSGK